MTAGQQPSSLLETDWERDGVVVVVIVGNEEDRKGEQRVATEFHPVIWVVHNPFTVISSNYIILFCGSFPAHNELNTPFSPTKY